MNEMKSLSHYVKHLRGCIVLPANGERVMNVADMYLILV